jgi:hypothetical protein
VGVVGLDEAVSALASIAGALVALGGTVGEQAATARAKSSETADVLMVQPSIVNANQHTGNTELSSN